jgi:hypothetical protein
VVPPEAFGPFWDTELFYVAGIFAMQEISAEYFAA